MTRLFWLTVVMSASAACDAGSPVDSDARPPDSPVGFTFETVEGGFASFGWSGQLHQVTGAPGTPFGVTAQCDDSGVCQLQGPSAPASPVQRQRCAYRTSRLCATDDECGPAANGGKDYRPCVYIYDAPVASPLQGSDGKLGACSFSYIPPTTAGKPSITGTLNLTTAALNLANLTVLLPLNVRRGTPTMPGGFFGVCAECVGDSKPNDGEKQGICRKSTRSAHADEGPDVGLPCDVHRYGAIPGFDGSYSMDCSATLIPDPLIVPTQFGGSFTSKGYQIDITPQSPKCTVAGFEGEHCICGMCADGKTACMSSAECGGGACGAPSTEQCDPNPYPGDPGHDPLLAIHQCKMFVPADPAKFGIAGNACVDGACNWDDEINAGTCISRLTGRTIGCYPHGLDRSIVVPGRALRKTSEHTVYYADTADARCIAASQSSALNSQLGLPGLMFQKRNFLIIPSHGERP